MKNTFLASSVFVVAGIAFVSTPKAEGRELLETIFVLPHSCVGIMNDPTLKDSFRQNGAVKFSADTGLGLTLLLSEKSFSHCYEIENGVPFLPNQQK